MQTMNSVLLQAFAAFVKQKTPHQKQQTTSTVWVSLVSCSRLWVYAIRFHRGFGQNCILTARLPCIKIKVFCVGKHRALTLVIWNKVND